MNILRNIKLTTPSNKSFLMDAFYKTDSIQKPVVIFSHGFKGFKDWGTWDLIAQSFADAGYVFIKYNFSHNGTTIDNPIEYDNLEAFAQNTYTQELEDLETVINWATENGEISEKEINRNKITLIGHSRGGGTSIIKASTNTKITSLITWASVERLDYAMNDPEALKKWKEDGRVYVVNGRTKQNMPLNYSLYEDFIKNKEDYSISTQLPQLNIPICVIHGTEDPAVPLDSARYLSDNNKGATLNIIDGADHVFGGSHPYTDTVLPKHCQDLLGISIDFLDNK